MSSSMTRRQLLLASARVASMAPAAFLFGCGQGSAEQAAVPGTNAGATAAPTVEPTPVITELETRLRKELVRSSQHASASGQWTNLEFNNLIDSMGEDSLKRACKTLEIPPAQVEQYASTTSMKREIKRTVLDASRFFPGGNPDEIQYHENVLIPTARNVELDDAVIMDYDTLSLERAVFNKVFQHNWTSLNENERLHFLEQSGWELNQNTSIDLAALGGASFLTVLTTVVNLSGFSFYINMSNGLFALASSMGLVLPFSAYMCFSTAVSVATGPIGWVSAAILAGTALYDWLTKNKMSSEAYMLRTVLHFHQYKVSAMEQAQIPFEIQGV